MQNDVRATLISKTQTDVLRIRRVGTQRGHSLGAGLVWGVRLHRKHRDDLNLSHHCYGYNVRVGRGLTPSWGVFRPMHRGGGEVVSSLIKDADHPWVGAEVGRVGVRQEVVPCRHRSTPAITVSWTQCSRR